MPIPRPVFQGRPATQSRNLLFSLVFPPFFPLALVILSGAKDLSALVFRSSCNCTRHLPKSRSLGLPRAPFAGRPEAFSGAFFRPPRHAHNSNPARDAASPA